MTTSTINYQSLKTPVAKSDVSAFRSDVRAGRYGASAAASTTISRVWISVAALIVVGALASAIPLVTGGNGTEWFAGFVIMGAAAAAAVVMLVKAHTSWATWCQLANFARANGWAMQPRVAGPPYPGMLFSLGKKRFASERVYGGDDHIFDMANYQYTTGSGKSSRNHTWHYIAVKLDRRLPNIVLDARANNGVFGSNLPHTLAGDQVLSLEGNFDDSFTLYCPSGYERDALYIFTPDLMALLIDNVALYDVEIVDDWMFFYSTKKYEALDASVWRRMLQIVTVVGAKTANRTELYRDERMVATGAAPLDARESTDNRVATPGRRLRRGANWTLIVVIGLAVAYWIASRVLPVIFAY